uniref:RING-type domain-containing protein n=1 Tax=Mycena chlorophos TaxID=658473 RepID=A0ABQ0M7R0_MYCCL|nr:predicted protein [Mycena chlorophos]
MDHDVLQTIQEFWQSLPCLDPSSLNNDDSGCPICLVDWPLVECGITKLQCGHIFCRNDLSAWIRNLRGSCPTCRAVFLDIRPPSSDDESSDGGEYVPPDEIEEEEDSFAFTSDGFTDAESNADEVDMEDDSEWDRSSMADTGPEDEDTDGEDELASDAFAEMVDVPTGIDDQEVELDDSQSSDDQELK